MYPNFPPTQQLTNMNENFGYGYGYAAPMPNLVQANIPEELAYQTQHENYLPFDAYLNSYSLNTYPENLEDTFSTAEPAQEQLLDFYAPGLDASLLAPSTSAQKFTDQPVLPESSTSLFPASANYELFNFGEAAQNTSNVQFNFNFSLDYTSIPRTVSPLDQRRLAACNANGPVASSSCPPLHTAPQSRPHEEPSNKRKRNSVGDHDHPQSQKKQKIFHPVDNEKEEKCAVYICDLEGCKYTTSSKRAFDRHSETKGHAPRKYPCPLCKKEYSRPDAVTRHCKAVHKKPSPSGEPNHGLAS